MAGQLHSYPELLADAHTQCPSITGRRIVITGGTTGIGRATAILLASEGANLFICGRSQQHLDDALQRINLLGNGRGMSCDLAQPGMPGEMLDQASDALSGIDTVIVNAAVSADDLAGTEQDQIDYQLAVDFTAWIATAKAAIERMKDGGDLVFIGSTSAVSRSPGSSVYVATKAGIQGFVQALRLELGERDIKVGLVEPGLTGSDMQYGDYSSEEQRELIGKDQMLRAEDIAVAVYFVLTQPRRTNISLVRVESRLKPE